jgi:hypothetical protein
LPEHGAFYIMDRGFLDFERLYRFHEAGSFSSLLASTRTNASRLRCAAFASRILIPPRLSSF